MSRPLRESRALVEEAARLICVEELTDYGAAKRKAAGHLGLPPQSAALPDNAAIHEAVVQYQRLFGGEVYRRQLTRMRSVAASAMRLLAGFSPRLVGATLSGAVHGASRVQLHLFADAAEMVDIELLNRGIEFDQGERRYRYANGRERMIPLLHLMLDGQGVDLAVFDDAPAHSAPISPLDGRPFRRADLAEVEALLARG